MNKISALTSRFSDFKFQRSGFRFPVSGLRVWVSVSVLLSCCSWVSLGQNVAPPVRIMPLGDSLTSSLPGHSSYRLLLWRYLQNGGFNVDFVGSMTGVGQGVPAPGVFDQDNEGHPGATTWSLLEDIDQWAAATRPDVVLLLVGATDIEDGYSPADTLLGSCRLMGRLRVANPYVKILWGLLPPAAGEMNSLAAYNAGARRLAPRISTRWSPIQVVDLWTGFDPRRDTFDGIHPNESGETKFANRFCRLLVPLLR